MKFLTQFCILIILGALASCSSKSYVKRGDKMLESGRYYYAQSLYEKAYKKSKDKEAKADIAFKAASCFDQVNQGRKASSWYRKAIMNRDTFSNAVLNLAYVEVKNGRMEEAEENFWEYVDLKPEVKKEGDPSEMLERIKKWEEFPGRYKVELLKDFSSTSSDFAPIYMGKDTNVIFFSSNRKLKDKPKKDGVTGEYYSNIFESHYSNEVVRKSRKKKGKKMTTRKVLVDTYQWSKARGVGDTINSDWNEGAACFSPEADVLYYTSSMKVNKNNQGTKIFVVKREDDGWGRVSQLDLVPDSLSVGHPSISADGNILYFVSDMPGGYGGNDIWMAKKSGSSWSEPQNLGRPINTPNDELFPYIKENGDLFFASDRTEGMGGLDIYQAKREKTGVWTVENMKYPINSTADDFAMVFQIGQEKGMFTSSRKKGNDDIYRFDFVPLQFSFVGNVVNSESKEPVEKARVHIVSSDGNQKDVKANQEGKFTVDLLPGLEYVVMVSADGYLNGKELVNTLDLTVSRNFKAMIGLNPIEKPIELPNIFYDFGSWTLRDESKTALDGLVETLNDNPKITIELGSHTDFVGSESTNQGLSQKRAQSVVDYLIEKGINWDRLVAQGYGEAKPLIISSDKAKEYDFLKEGDVLTEWVISKLQEKQKEIANQLNRRTDFRVLSTDYVPGPNSKNKPGVNSDQIGNTIIKNLSGIKGVFYTIQIGAFSKNTIPPVIQKYKVVFRGEVDANTVRYTTGIFDDVEEARAEADKITKTGIKAFVIAYNKGKKITFAEAKKMKK
ncbi:OmpA family protein [Labilibaculum sp. DW002]|uniref:OmpA family protein n=1 Tax=Paralabilibaculum antarcticum TaxID=2912572 RepID=A0ABT5VYJ7_9BACT|nr:OmpA family protein [Labilibaculum sp. DW002]MDE5420421.1 OmpA family protein [Labilibaculum sp. DW002]